MTTLTPISTSVAVQLGTGTTTIYTATEQTLAVVLHLANATAGPITVTIYIVPSGDSAADDVALCKDYSIAGNDYLVLNCGNLAADTVLSGLASSGASITAQVISGVQRT